MPGTFRFSFGPWNIHEGADPFGPTVRPSIAFAEKLKLYKKLGFEGVQFHDDDAVPTINQDPSPAEIQKTAQEMRRMLDGEGLVAEIVAPRLWEDPRTIDGGYTANNPAERQYAIERSLQCIDIGNILGTNKLVLWLAREGTYIREAKDAAKAVELLVTAINKMLAHDPNVRILVEPKPNEPMDLAYIPTIGHAVGLSYLTDDPSRVGVLMESAHAILAGLDPSDELSYAIAHKKLWSVHLNDQNGLKFDEDKAFGAVDLRRAFMQVWVLDRNGYGNNGEFVGLDVKAMRTQKAEAATQHLSNSREIFLALLDVARSLDTARLEALIAERNYEQLEMEIIRALLGRK
ncbi:MAG: xylose isomerase [Anaerolineae bacterium]|nr:TIM barrel protein [Anaerolineales bacterium]MCQ3974229.1 xylose isomerase [Anaerolineae bacterium]